MKVLRGCTRAIYIVDERKQAVHMIWQAVSLLITGRIVVVMNIGTLNAPTFPDYATLEQINDFT